MSKASKIVVLCEDQTQSRFVYRFLKTGWDVNTHLIRIETYPHGKGSGKQFVEDNIGGEVKALRARAASTILIVVRDADEDTVDEAVRKLNSKFEPHRDPKEPIVYIIPKWHIETWVAWLDGVDVDESEKRAYKDRYENICQTKKIHRYLDDLVNQCKQRKSLKSPPDSLVVACKEFKRIRDALS